MVEIQAELNWAFVFSMSSREAGNGVLNETGVWILPNPSPRCDIPKSAGGRNPRLGIFPPYFFFPFFAVFFLAGFLAGFLATFLTAFLTAFLTGFFAAFFTVFLTTFLAAGFGAMGAGAGSSIGAGAATGAGGSAGGKGAGMSVMGFLSSWWDKLRMGAEDTAEAPNGAWWRNWSTGIFSALRHRGQCSTWCLSWTASAAARAATTASELIWKAQPQYWHLQENADIHASCFVSNIHNISRNANSFGKSFALSRMDQPTPARSSIADRMESKKERSAPSMLRRSSPLRHQSTPDRTKINPPGDEAAPLGSWTVAMKTVIRHGKFPTNFIRFSWQGRA